MSKNIIMNMNMNMIMIMNMKIKYMNIILFGD